MRKTNSLFCFALQMAKIMFGTQLLILLLTACNDDSRNSTTDPMPWSYSDDMDETVLPENDFYEYALGEWLGTATLPPGQNIYGINEEAYDKQIENIKKLLDSTNDPTITKLRQDGTNNELTEQNSINALKRHLLLVQNIYSETDLLKCIGNIISLGYKPFLSVTVAPINGIFAPRLNAGYTFYSDSYYYQPGSTHFNIYKEWIAYCFQMIGYSKEDAYRKADNAINIERSIAICTNPDSYTLKYWSDADNYSRLKKLSQTNTKAASSIWDVFIESMGLDPQLTKIYEPAIPILDIISEQDTEILKDYIENCIIQSNRDYLPMEFRQKEEALFNNKILPANLLINNAIKQFMTYHISKLYVEKYFDPSYKQRGTEMANEMRNIFKRRIENLDWMSGTTKSKAIAKLEAMKFNIGYPDAWNELGSPRLSGNCLCADIMLCREQNYKFNISISGKSIKEGSWDFVIPQNPLYIVNAFYYPPLNSLIIPAATMLPPVYDLSVSDAFNYAALGATTIGHEMTHGFDNNGSRFNQDGVVEDWWTLADKLEFKKRQEAFVECFNSMEAWPGLQADGEKTLGENIADLGGLEIAHQTFMEKKANEGFKGSELENQEKKFYLSFAQAWKAIYTQEYAIKATQTDVHSLPKLRVNGIVIHTDAWYNAFDVQWGDKLFIQEDMRTHIW